jgi:hypothetical protein
MPNETYEFDSFFPQDLARELMPGWRTIDRWFEWPPDLFALTSILLKTTGLYRLVVIDSVVARLTKPERLDVLVRDWYSWIRDERKQFPRSLRKLKDVVFGEKYRLHSTQNEDELTAEFLPALISLHALADQACAGFGISSRRSDMLGELGFIANLHLALTGSLSTLPMRHGIVLPKSRTPQSGLSLRSLSHHLTYHQTEASILWRSIPWVNREDQENTINVLAIPHPYNTQSIWFKPVRNPVPEAGGTHFRLFNYEPDDSANLSVASVIALVMDALKKVSHVHVLVFPELALKECELRQLQSALIKNLRDNALKRDEKLPQIPLIVAGLRDQIDDAKKQHSVNRVVLSTYFANRWYDLWQHKHHRWKLDDGQIERYALAGTLNVGRMFWEATPIRHRRLIFLVPNGWMNLCPLICEDLARLEPMSSLIRGVGPTLVLATLMDGPQLSNRWSARYVGVLADDPGSSVLTLSSLGMVQQSRLNGKPVDLTVGLWKDSLIGERAITFEKDTAAALLTLNATWTEEWTADGRSDQVNAAVFALRSLQFLPKVHDTAVLDSNNVFVDETERAQTVESEPTAETTKGGASRDGTNSICETDYAAEADIIEVTALSYYVDAALRADPFMFERLTSVALVDMALIGDHDTRASERLLPRVRNAWNTKVKEGGTAKGAEYRGAVEIVSHFLRDQVKLGAISKNSSRAQETRGDLKDRLDRAMRLIANASKYFTAPKFRNQPGRDVRLAYLSILWGVHNEVVSVRRTAERTKADPDTFKKLYDLQQEIEKYMDDEEKAPLTPRASGG